MFRCRYTPPSEKYVGRGDKQLKIEELQENNRAWARSLLRERWGSSDVVTRGHLHHADQLPGFVAIENNAPVGLITYFLSNASCEIITLDSLESGKGIGTAMINKVREAARLNDCARLWLITTNDNTDALRFYQRVGFELVAIHKGAIAESRKLKPQIPVTGNNGIPIRDEIELEITEQQ